MNLIQFQQATYAVRLRDQLELAGCDTRVAAVISRTVGELVDHVADTERELKRAAIDRDLRASVAAAALRPDPVERVIAVFVLTLVAVIAGGILVALFS